MVSNDGWITLWIYFKCTLICTLIVSLFLLYFLVVEGSSLCSSVFEVSSCYAVLLPFNHWSSCLSLPGSIITDIPSHWIILYFKMRNFIGLYVWNKQISNELSLSPHQPFSFPQWEEIRSHFYMFFMLTCSQLSTSSHGTAKHTEELMSWTVTTHQK